jgi:hypothetical protein
MSDLEAGIEEVAEPTGPQALLAKLAGTRVELILWID